MHLVRPFAAVVLAAALAACSDSNGPGNQSDVSVQDNSFAPSALSVSAGTTVTWEWAGNNQHNVTWVGPGAPAASATQTTGTYQRMFDATGEYDYYCTIHGTPTSGMRGSVTVP